MKVEEVSDERQGPATEQEGSSVCLMWKDQCICVFVGILTDSFVPSSPTQHWPDSETFTESYEVKLVLTLVGCSPEG